jgi:thiamine kinase-like enzyme
LAAAAYDAAVDWWGGPDPTLLRTRPPVTVLGHGDANLANYLWDGRRVRIVDFEDATVSDPAAELANLVEHISARHLDGAGFCARFDVDPVRLLASRRLWAMFWLRLLLPGGPAERRNAPGTAERQARRLLDLLSAG